MGSQREAKLGILGMKPHSPEWEATLRAHEQRANQAYAKASQQPPHKNPPVKLVEPSVSLQKARVPGPAGGYSNKLGT